MVNRPNILCFHRALKQPSDWKQGFLIHIQDRDDAAHPASHTGSQTFQSGGDVLVL